MFTSRLVLSVFVRPRFSGALKFARHASQKPPKKSKPMDDIRRKPPSDLMILQAAEVERRTTYFDEVKKDMRDKKAFQKAIGTFVRRDIRRAGHVDFIYAALKRLKAFGVHEDLEVYKELLNVFPKGRFVAQNMWQVEFMHYPRQQECCLDVLCEMEKNGVIPDIETYHIVLNAFGDRSIAMRKLKRLLYWYPKFKNANPYPIPRPLPRDPTELARIALNRICPDLRKEITTFQTEEFKEAQDHTWVASCICPDQKAIISRLLPDRPLYVEGQFPVHLREESLGYFLLKDEPDQLLESGEIVVQQYYDKECSVDWDLFFKVEKPKEYAPVPSIHEQDDGKILALCITGTASKDSLRSWIAYLAKTNPQLRQRPIVFRIRSLTTDTEVIPVTNEPSFPEVVIA